jgi:uncharacterized protein YjbI with pentapeptide repeats
LFFDGLIDLLNAKDDLIVDKYLSQEDTSLLHSLNFNEGRSEATKKLIDVSLEALDREHVFFNEHNDIVIFNIEDSSSRMKEIKDLYSRVDNQSAWISIYVLNKTETQVDSSRLIDLVRYSNNVEEIPYYLKNLDNADLSGAQLMTAQFRYASLGNTNFKGALLNYANFSGSNLSNADLSNADLSHAQLNDTNLSGANLQGANLSNAAMGSTNLGKANLSHATLNGAYLSGADLTGAKLIEADLKDVKIDIVSFKGADLTGAKLNNAKIYGSDFQDANLTNANFYDAELDETSIYNAASLQRTDLSKFKYSTDYDKEILRSLGAII